MTWLYNSTCVRELEGEYVCACVHELEGEYTLCLGALMHFFEFKPSDQDQTTHV